MSDDRETYEAIEQRRNASCLAGKEFHDEWIEDLCGLIPEDDVPRYSNPEGAAEAIILDCFRAYTAERDALAAAVDRVRALHSQDTSLLAPGKWCPACGEETPCATIRALAAPARRPDTQQGDGDG